MKNKTLMDKIFKLVNIVTSEYIIGTCIYLLSMFVLSIGKSLNWLNFAYWVIVFNYIFEKFLLKKDTSLHRAKTINVLNIAIRILVIIINILAFGINIINFN